MNVIFLTSSTFSEPILRDFQSTLNSTTFSESSQYKIIENPPINEHFIDQIKNKVVPNETINVINKMASIDHQIK